MGFDWAPYKGREQSGVKHFILGEYLASFAPIIGTFCDTITYIDCFSGPWKAKTEKYDDTSFSVALRELKKASEHKARLGGTLGLRAFFVESDAESFAELEGYCAKRPADGIEVACRHGELEHQIADIVNFVKAGGSKNFPFIFIDPTGWSGFSLEAITPLLKLRPCEVLINFMTSHITRWVGHPDPEQRQVFDDLYGAERSARVIDRTRDKSGLEREDILLAEYMDAIRNVGRFDHVSAAVVLNPDSARTHFHLIYAARHPKGVEVFKAAEKKAMVAMQQQRALVKDRQMEERDAKQGQFALDIGSGLPRVDDFYEGLRERYLKVASGRALYALKKAHSGLDWTALAAIALEVPLTFLSDLKEWVRRWQESGSVEITGLQGKERVPRSGSKVIWRLPVDLSPFEISELMLDGQPATIVPPLTISPELEEETGERLVARAVPFPFTLHGPSREGLKDDLAVQLATAIRRFPNPADASLRDEEAALAALVRERVRR